MAIGLEFQTNWTVEKSTGGEYRKETSLFGDRRGIVGWSMETDGSDVEFVVEPAIEESDAGRAKLQRVMSSMTNHIRKMEFAGQHGDKLTKGSAKALFGPMCPQDAVLDRTPGTGKATLAQPQITIGIRLGRIQEFVEEMGRMGLAAKNPNALFDREGKGSQYYSKDYAEAASLAANAPPLPVGPGGTNRPPSNKLKGLLTMTTQYLLGGKQFGSRAYAKDMAWAMSRTDFASMFRQLSGSESEYFQRAPQRWVDYALVVAGLYDEVPDPRERGEKAKVTRKYANELLIQQGITDGGKHMDQPFKLPLTRGAWLRDMALGVNAVDRFTAKGLSGPALMDGGGTHRLRAPGLLGNRFDEVGNQKRDGGRHKGVIVELRQMRTNVHYSQWTQLALDVFDFARQVNERSDKWEEPRVQFSGETHLD